MAAIPNDVRNNINSLYDQQKKNQLSQLADSQRKATGELNTQKQQTNQQYYDKRNQADVVNFQNRRALQEMMAASGLGRSGENVSGQIGLQAARQNTLGGLNRDEQNIIGGFNRQIADINDPSRQNAIISEIDAARSAALAQALERAIERAEQQRQFNAQLAWQKEQFNRQMAEKKAAAARSGGGRSSGGSGGSSSSSPSGGMSLNDLYNQYKGSGADLSGLQKNTGYFAKASLKSIEEQLAEERKKKSAGGASIIRFQQ